MGREHRSGILTFMSFGEFYDISERRWECACRGPSWHITNLHYDSVSMLTRGAILI